MLAQVVPSHVPSRSAVPVTRYVSACAEVARSSVAAAVARTNRLRITNADDPNRGTPAPQTDVCPVLTLRPGRIAPAGADDLVAFEYEVAHEHRALRDARQRARTGVLDEPLGAPDGGGAEPAGGPEVAFALAPEVALLGLLGRGVAAALGARRERLGERGVGAPAALAELEDALVEGRLLGRCARLGDRGDLDLALAGVERRADGDRRSGGEGDELLG